MKMYYFSIGGYNEEYHVMAESQQDALLFLRRYCEELESDLSSCMSGYYIKQHEYFKNNPEFIFELDQGVVVRTEVS